MDNSVDYIVASNIVHDYRTCERVAIHTSGSPDYRSRRRFTKRANRWNASCPRRKARNPDCDHNERSGRADVDTAWHKWWRCHWSVCRRSFLRWRFNMVDNYDLCNDFDNRRWTHEWNGVCLPGEGDKFGGNRFAERTRRGNTIWCSHGSDKPFCRCWKFAGCGDMVGTSVHGRNATR